MLQRYNVHLPTDLLKQIDTFIADKIRTGFVLSLYDLTKLITTLVMCRKGDMESKTLIGLF